MARPEPKFVTLTIDGREVRAPEGAMLVDGAKYGDIEIPVFCYEPKLGHPVGACRMCLVEIEGIPKLQTACSTAVADGMVVSTQNDRVKESQSAVVEFLLVNHPLDCPVCDKGGECPLQDITMGWGPGKNRFIDAKRHFKKPIYLSPLIAIDRERCILCYRCARFSQEVSEDYQLTLLERSSHSFIGTFDGHPYVAPFSGNITELCPVGALTSTAYRFRARPWDIENSGSICTLCPSQCNIHFTVRDERVMRVLERQNDEVDDGWLCDKGRFGYELIESELRVTEPLVRVGDKLRATTWDQAFERIVEGLGAAGPASAALAGGETSNEEGYLLQRLMRRGLGSPHVDSRSGGSLDPAAALLLARPELAATISDIDHAGAVLVVDAEPVDDAAIFDLRVRKAVSRNGARLVVATGRPSTLDGGAGEVLRFAPGQAEAVLRALVAALDGAERAGLEELCQAAGLAPRDLKDAAKLLSAADGVVVLWGERIGHGPRGAEGLRALCNLALALGLEKAEGSGLIELPAAANGRGLREVGCLPNLGPGLAHPEAPGRDAAGIAEAAAAGDLPALFLLHTDPVADHPDREAWEGALSKAGFVAAQTLFLSAGIAEHADVVLPAESYAEKDGTLTHPDGRLQRQRPAVGRPGSVRMGWQVLADLCRALGDDTGVLTGPMATDALAAEVPFYAGLSADEIGGLGVRWQEREAAGAAPAAPLEPFKLGKAPAGPQPVKGDRVLVHTYRPLWSGDAVDHSPPLSFLRQRQRLELAPGEADRLGLVEGDAVELHAGDRGLRAEVVVRDALAPGAAYLIEGTAEEPANLLAGAEPVLVDVARAERRPADAEIALPVAGGVGG